MLNISDRLDNLDRVLLSEMRDIQGDLKALPKGRKEKLLNLLRDHGIILPFALWERDNSILDGNQRRKVILEEWGDLAVPVIWIDADTLDEAKRVLLAISSQFGMITEQGLEEFGVDLDDVVASFSFDALPYTFKEYEPSARIDPTLAGLYDNMPDYAGDNLYADAQKISFYFHGDDAERQALSAFLGVTITDRTKTVHYPPSGAITFDSKAWIWEDDSEPAA